VLWICPVAGKRGGDTSPGQMENYVQTPTTAPPTKGPADLLGWRAIVRSGKNILIFMILSA
jgi:hypothetical protein